jgi:CBS domain-containing protein
VAHTLKLTPSDDFLEEEPTLEHERLGGLVNGPVVVVAIDRPMEEVRRLLVEYRVPAIAVVDGDELYGVLTRTDALRAINDNAVAGDAVSRFVLSLPATASIARAAALIAYENVGQVVVTDRDGSLLGMVSAVDLLRYFVSNTTRPPRFDAGRSYAGLKPAKK